MGRCNIFKGIYLALASIFFIVLFPSIGYAAFSTMGISPSVIDAGELLNDVPHEITVIIVRNDASTDMWVEVELTGAETNFIQGDSEFMFKAGEILHYINFPFVDGKRVNKLFIVLHDLTPDNISVFAITTSQEKHFKDATIGCNENYKCFVISSNRESMFPKTTYVKLEQLYPFEYTYIEKNYFNGVIKKCGFLSEECFNEILSCLKKLSDFIPPVFRKLIF